MKKFRRAPRKAAPRPLQNVSTLGKTLVLPPEKLEGTRGAQPLVAVGCVQRKARLDAILSSRTGPGLAEARVMSPAERRNPSSTMWLSGARETDASVPTEEESEP